MKDLKEVKIFVVRTQYQEIVINEENGYEMPKTIKDLIALSGNIQNSAVNFADEDRWSETEIVIDDIVYIE